jgi:hypothetical protein
MSDASKFNIAIKNIQDAGGYAGRRVSCCQGCSWAEWEIKGVTEADTVLFTHQQSEEGAWLRGGKLKRDVYMYWQGDKEVIFKAFNDAGLKVEVPASTTTAFILKAR